MLQIVSLLCCFIFLSTISTNFNIIIDRAIEALGYWKDDVDGINAYDKRYLMGKYV